MKTTLFTGTLMSGDVLTFFDDRTWQENHDRPGMESYTYGRWGERDGKLLIEDRPGDVLSRAVPELQEPYREWLAKELNRLIVGAP